MSILFSLLALAVFVGDLSRQPPWQTDYQAALVQGARQNRPLAVFLAPGQAGWDKLAQGGKLSKEVQQLLGGKYVPVYLNTDTVKGKELASSFDLPGGTGLVLSDRQGEHQAFWHVGALADTELASALERHADATSPVLMTETNLVTQTSYYGPVVTPTYTAPGVWGATSGFQQMSAPACSH
jgi:hypothetical protein